MATASVTATAVTASPANLSDSKVSQGDGAVKSDVKSDAKSDAKSDDATAKDRTKLTLKLPPRPEDYDYYWYQDDDGTWRNEYDDQVTYHSNRIPPLQSYREL